MNPPLGAYRLVGKTDVTPAIVNCEVNHNVHVHRAAKERRWWGGGLVGYRCGASKLHEWEINE